MIYGSYAYLEGYEAFDDGIIPIENPYDPETDPQAHRHWQIGYQDAWLAVIGDEPFEDEEEE